MRKHGSPRGHRSSPSLMLQWVIPRQSGQRKRKKKESGIWREGGQGRERERECCGVCVREGEIEREQLLAWRRARGARGNQIFVGNNVSCHRRKWLRFSVLCRWLQERKRKEQAPSETGAGPGDEMARDQPTWTVMGFARRTRHMILLDSSPRTKIGVT